MKEIVLNPPIALATSRTTFPCPLAPHNTKSPISPRLGWAPHELRHRGMARLADALSPNYICQGQPKNLDVEPQTTVIHVPHVQLKLLFPGKAVASVHLHPPGNARPHLMTASLERGVSGQVFGEQRPRADQTHIPLEYVPDLRQLIEARAAKEPSQRREPLFVDKQFSSLIADVGHRAELEK